jgi:predicted ATP-grasp superfamily ATP-dependent carboligase
MMETESVLVLDSQGQNSLALTRTLGRKGLSVIAGGSSRYLPGMLSKYADDSYVHPDPATEPSAFVEDLESYLSTHDIAATFALTDLVTSVLSLHKDRLEATGTRIGVEDWETFLAANDKKRLFELAEDLDVPSPRTHAPETMADLDAIDRERDYKVVVKPRRTTFIDGGDEGHTNRMRGENYVEPEEDLRTRFRSLIADNSALQQEYPLVQEFIDGVETKCTVGLADEGELVAFFQHEKDRVYPLSGGVGSIRQGTWEPRMKEYAEEVVAALEWTGPVHVEFMETPDGDFSLLEVNGRYWGALALAINSGVNVPWLHYRQLVDPEADLSRLDGYRTDIRQRKLFFRDVQWLRAQFDRGNYSAIRPFLASFARSREELLDPTDPLPFLGVAPRVVDVLTSLREGNTVY